MENPKIFISKSQVRSLVQVKAAMYDPVTQEWQHLDPKRAGFTSNIVYTITHTKMGRSIDENKKKEIYWNCEISFERLCI